MVNFFKMAIQTIWWRHSLFYRSVHFLKFQSRPGLRSIGVVYLEKWLIAVSIKLTYLAIEHVILYHLPVINQITCQIFFRNFDFICQYVWILFSFWNGKQITVVYSSSSCRPQLIGCSTYRIINSFYEYLPSLMALSLFSKLVSIFANNAKSFKNFIVIGLW